MRLLAALVLLTSCNRTTPVDDRTAGASSPLVTSTAPVHEIAWLRQSKLDLPARATPRATERGFELRADGAAAGFVRHGLHVVAPAFANGTVRLASSVRDDVWLELFADDLAHASRGALEDDALVFRDVQPATDLVWMMGGDRFEELRVIHEPRSRVEGRWHVRLGPGLRELVVVEGQIRAIDARGYAWFQSLPLVAVDAKGTSRNAVASVARSSGGFTLVVGADTSAMTPPIALDPSFTSGGVLKAPVTDHWAGKLATGKVFIGYGVPELYDPATNTASYLPATPAGVGPGTGAIYGGRAAMAGGSYDDATGTWSPITMSDYNYSLGVGVTLTGGNVVLFGGYGSGCYCVTEQLSGTPMVAKKLANAPMALGSSSLSLRPARAIAVGSKVLVVAGSGSGTPATWYDTATNTWTGTTIPSSESAFGRTYATLGLMPDGDAIVAGGTWGSELSSVARYDTATSTWSLVPNLPEPRMAAAAATTPKGVMIIGGANYDGSGYHPSLSTSRYFDGTTWTPGPSLATARAHFALTALGGGKWLASGGQARGGESGTPYSTTEIFSATDPGVACTDATSCDVGLSCVDSVCCNSASCPTGSHCNHPLTKGTCKKDQGQACSAASECGTGNCVDGYCCDSACGAVGKCNVAGKLGKCVGIDGQPCTAGAGCVSNFCTDGVCCNVACAGTCEACTAAKKGAGTDGTCGFVIPDSDPDNECPTDPGFPASCKADGMCDGLGKCRTYAKNTVACGTTTCAAGTVSGKVCNGGGLCDTSSTPCDPYACGTTECKTSCATNADCAPSAFCNSGGKCVTGKANGESCAKALECKSGFCADGFCCNAPCTGQCEACSESGSEGSCIPVTGAPRGTRSPCAGDVAVCGGSCNGAKTTDCSYAPTTKSCGRACTDGKATQKICDGLGACVEGERKPCLPYACEDTERCRIDCTADSHCAPTYKCSGGVCVSIGGAKCTPDNSGSISADGKESSCGAFTCDPSTGNCRPICQISADCAPDNICNTATKACEPPPPEASGGCAFAPPSSGAALGLLLLCAAIARGRRIDRKR